MLFQKKLKGYDVAIAFHQEDSPKATVSGFYRFVYKKTDAKVKLGWIHYVKDAVSFNDNKNLKYMKKMDKLVCVSKSTANNFAMWHPEIAGKIDYCYNFHEIEKIKTEIEEIEARIKEMSDLAKKMSNPLDKARIMNEIIDLRRRLVS